MKLEVGMYVRTKFRITKIDEINENKTKWKYLVDKINNQDGTLEYNALSDDLILKSSYNIIDLIEVGDYVNGEYVTDIDLTYFNGTDRLEEPKRIGVIVGNDEMFKFSYHIKKEDIKSIVTKEQFEKESYKVGK